MERIKPVPEYKPINISETPQFQGLDPQKQRLLRKAEVFGIVPAKLSLNPSKIEAVAEQIADDFNSARHEMKHGKAILGMPGAELTGMSINPGPGYRAITLFMINPHIPIEDKAWIILVASMASGVEDNLQYHYDHSGRGSDEAQAENAANIISIRRGISKASVKAQARSTAASYVSNLDEDSVWSLVYKDRKAA